MSLPDLLREKDEISEQLQFLNKNVEDLSSDELKNIISMRERLKEIVYALDNMKSGIAGRIDTIELLMINLLQNLEVELSKIKNILAVNVNQNIEHSMDWLDVLEKRLKEFIEYIEVAGDVQTCQTGLQGNGCKHDVVPWQISGDEKCECKRQHGKKETRNEKAELEEMSLKSVANNLKKIEYKPSTVRRVQLNKNIRVSIVNKHEAGEKLNNVFGVAVDNYLPEENELKKIKEFINNNDNFKDEGTVIDNPKLIIVKHSENIVNSSECLNNIGDGKTSLIDQPGIIKEISLFREEVIQDRIIGSAEAEVAASQSEMILPEIVSSPAKDSSTRGRRKSSRTKGKANSKKR